MGKIREYNLQSNVAGPARVSSASSADTGQVGAHLVGLGQAAQSYGSVLQKAQERDEVSDISAKMSKVQADYTNKLNDTLQKATPDDLAGGTPRGAPGSQSISEKFMTDLDTQLSDLGNGVSSGAAQEYYTKASANLREHFSTQSVKGQAALVGAKAVTDAKANVENGSSMLMNDPTAFDTVTKNYNSYIDHMVAAEGLPAEKAIELRRAGIENFAEGASRGWMNADPELGKKQLIDGKWDEYLSGDAKKRLIGEADMHITAKRVEEERVKKAEKEAKKQVIDAEQDKMLVQIYDNKLSAKDIVNSKNLDFDAKREMLAALSKHSAGQAKTDPQVFNSLWDQMHLPDGDPNKLTDVNQLNQYVGEGLSITDLSKLRKEMTGKGTPEGQQEAMLKKGFTDIAKGQLTKSNSLTGIQDPAGDQNYQTFLAQFTDEYNRQRAQGKTAMQLLNPKSPEYMGHIIDTYVKSPQQIQEELANQIRNAGGMGTKSQPAVAPAAGQIKVTDPKTGRTGRFTGTRQEAEAAGFKVE